MSVNKSENNIMTLKHIFFLIVSLNVESSYIDDSICLSSKL